MKFLSQSDTNQHLFNVLLRSEVSDSKRLFSMNNQIVNQSKPNRFCLVSIVVTMFETLS